MVAIKPRRACRVADRPTHGGYHATACSFVAPRAAGSGEPRIDNALHTGRTWKKVERANVQGWWGLWPCHYHSQSIRSEGPPVHRHLHQSKGGSPAPVAPTASWRAVRSQKQRRQSGAARSPPNPCTMCGVASGCQYDAIHAYGEPGFWRGRRASRISRTFDDHLMFQCLIQGRSCGQPT